MNAVYAMRDVCNVCARACIQKESNISEASYMQPQTHSREKTRKKTLRPLGTQLVYLHCTKRVCACAFRLIGPTSSREHVDENVRSNKSIY